MHAVQELAVTQRERVRVSMPPGLAGLLMPHLGKLQREHPDVTIETVSSGRYMGLKRGEVDLAIRLLPVVDESLIVRQLPDMAWSLYASPAYLKRHAAPKDVDDLSGHDLVAYGSDVVAQPSARWIEARSKRPAWCCAPTKSIPRSPPPWMAPAWPSCPAFSPILTRGSGA